MTEMTISLGLIIKIASVITALSVIVGLLLKIHKFYLHQKEQDDLIAFEQSEIESIKKEDALICFALSACLDGLIQLGANHNVPKAKEKLDKHLNIQAHEA